MKRKYDLYQITRILEDFVDDLRKNADSKVEQEFSEVVEYVISELINTHLFVKYAIDEDIDEVIERQALSAERVGTIITELMKEGNEEDFEALFYKSSRENS